mgnify:CR=1 FL=1
MLSQIASAGRVNIVVTGNQTEITKNIIETEIYGKPKTVHLALIGHGNVGGTLVEQILDSAYDILNRKTTDIFNIHKHENNNLIDAIKSSYPNIAQHITDNTQTEISNDPESFKKTF